MMDNTVMFRREMCELINSNAQPREWLEEKFGQVWDTKELQEDFTVLGFLAPFCHVEHKRDGARGTVTFQANPRYYFSFDAE